MWCETDPIPYLYVKVIGLYYFPLDIEELISFLKERKTRPGKVKSFKWRKRYSQKFLVLKDLDMSL